MENPLFNRFYTVKNIERPNGSDSDFIGIISFIKTEKNSFINFKISQVYVWENKIGYDEEFYNSLKYMGMTHTDLFYLCQDLCKKEYEPENI